MSLQISYFILTLLKFSCVQGDERCKVVCDRPPFFLPGPELLLQLWVFVWYWLPACVISAVTSVSFTPTGQLEQELEAASLSSWSIGFQTHTSNTPTLMYVLICTQEFWINVIYWLPTLTKKKRKIFFLINDFIINISF